MSRNGVKNDLLIKDCVQRFQLTIQINISAIRRLTLYLNRFLLLLSKVDSFIFFIVSTTKCPEYNFQRKKLSL